MVSSPCLCCDSFLESVVHSEPWVHSHCQNKQTKKKIIIWMQKKMLSQNSTQWMFKCCCLAWTLRLTVFLFVSCSQNNDFSLTCLLSRSNQALSTKQKQKFTFSQPVMVIWAIGDNVGGLPRDGHVSSHSGRAWCQMPISLWQGPTVSYWVWNSMLGWEATDG